MFNITVRSPDGGQLLFAMGDRVRFHMSVPDKLKEMAIILPRATGAPSSNGSLIVRPPCRPG